MEIVAPSRWKRIDCISDIHLDESDRTTFAVWQHYLRHTDADAVFILGDLFEIWVGDDVLAQSTSFLADCVAALHQAGQRLDLFILCGNRDFLMGPALMQACQASALADPTVLTFAGQRVVLTHGDALCLGDTDYQAFRHMVRSASWQSDFLAKPLPERQLIARGIRQQSESRKQAENPIAEVDAPAANALLDTLDAALLLHGHTHQAGQHALAKGRSRLVLSDWCLAAVPPRADLIRLGAAPSGGISFTRLNPATLHPERDSLRR
jgi:UDP-2,3-diacylglucosamine hydrolase